MRRFLERQFGIMEGLGTELGRRENGKSDDNGKREK